MTIRKSISLFAGVGMTDLATEAFGFETAITAEIDPFCRSVLQARFPNATHLDDVHKLNLAGYDHLLDCDELIVTGGFPCQDLSLSGYGAGLSGARSGLWSEFLRVISEFHPEYVLIENVAALRTRGLEKVLSDLHLEGYNARWDCIPAGAVGAPHVRDRMFIVGERRSSNGKFWKEEGDLPRAGMMVDGRVQADVPLATVSDVKRSVKRNSMLLPSPAAQNPGWRFVPLDRYGNVPDHPNQRFYHPGTGRVVQKGIEQIALLFPHLTPSSRPLLPTPTRSDGSGGPGTSPKRTGGKNLRTVVAEHEGNARLNPEFVEWMMGLPIRWTDPSIPRGAVIPHDGWGGEHPPMTTGRKIPDRAKRIRALGNGLVPQCAMVALDWILNV